MSPSHFTTNQKALVVSERYQHDSFTTPPVFLNYFLLLSFISFIIKHTLSEMVKY